VRYARPLIAGSTAVLAAILGATTAFAATTWTIKPGSAITATGMKVAPRIPRPGATGPASP